MPTGGPATGTYRYPRRDPLVSYSVEGVSSITPDPNVGASHVYCKVCKKPAAFGVVPCAFTARRLLLL